MNLTLRLPLDRAASPLPAGLLLMEHKTETFNNSEHGLRHPTAIYNISISSVVDAFSALLELLEKATPDLTSNDKDAAQVLRMTDHLLDAVTEHFDDCENILKVFYNDTGTKACGKVLRGWNATVRECRDFAAKQANKVKHEQGRLRLLEFQWDAAHTTGYFVEGVLKDGAIGPHPAIHPNGNSAYSYVRALRYFICTIVFASRALCTFIGPRARRHVDTTRHGLGQLAQTFERVLALGANVFPDEAAGATPRMERRLNNVVVEYPASIRIGTAPPSNGRIKLAVGGDGVSSKFKLPYFGTDVPNRR